MRSTRFLFILMAALLAGMSLAQAKEPATALESMPEDQLKKFRPTAEQPFAPSYITTDVGRKLEVSDWQDPQICAGCHPRQFKGWNGSMHSIAFKDPIFQAEWALAEKEMNGELMNHCGGCHNPVGVVTGTIKFDPSLGKHGGFTAEGVGNQGVSCDVCHTISDNNLAKTAVLEHGNASFVMSPGKIKRGPLRDAKSPFHETAYSDHHTKSEFCGNCHNIFHPGNEFPVERTFDEWKYSAYAQAGIQCQDCHMVPVDTAIRVADEMTRPKDLKGNKLGGIAGMGAVKNRSVVHDHGFVGGNAVIAKALGVSGADEHKAEAIKRLQNAADLEMWIKPGKNSLRQLEVKVNNRRAGHHLPTSLTFVRQIWLEVVITDEQGRELLRSGSLDDQNALPEDTVLFNNKAVDKDGKPSHKPWRIARFEQLNTIPPKGFRMASYAFNVPADSKHLKVSAKLHYRSLDQKSADYLLGDGAITVPSVQMYELEKEFTNDGVAMTDTKSDLAMQQ